ncbi:MAG: glycosyl transferase family 2 [Candidatus Tectimicrobiota bacterium]|nr:MAG: glycosyl transferase family 2 [Candidatus Tectomicrobia bacterium]
MPPLSVAMITYNEEARLREALESVQWADDIVVVDAGSTDGTVAIATACGARVVVHPWQGFVAQRNLALAQARHEWVLSLDADERLSPALQAEIRQLCATGMQADAYYVPRLSFFLGRWIRHSGWYPNYKIRLFRKSCSVWQGGEVHESLRVQGRLAYLRHPLLHYPYRDLAHNVHTINRYSTLGAQQLHARGRRAHWYDLTLRPLFTFLKKYGLCQGFRDGPPGLVIAAMTAYATFVKYAKLWELQQGYATAPELPAEAAWYGVQHWHKE